MVASIRDGGTLTQHTDAGELSDAGDDSGPASIDSGSGSEPASEPGQWLDRQLGWLNDVLVTGDESDDRIVVLDNFHGMSQTHGRNVAAIADDYTSSSASEIRRVNNVSVRPLEAILAQSMDQEIEHRALSLLESTNANLRTVLEDKCEVGVIVESMGASKASISASLLGEALSDPSACQQLAQELGLTDLPERSVELSEAQLTQLSEAIIARVSSVVDRSPAIKGARAEYWGLSQELEAAGINHVVTTGNAGEFVSFVKDQGISHEEDFSESVLANELKVVVGASNDHGPEGGIASFSDPS